MGVDITIKMDTREFERRMESSAQQTVNAIRSSVDKAARQARKEYISAAASDIGVSPAKVRRTVTLVRTTTQSNLSASFTASKQNLSPMDVGGGVDGGVLSWSTLRLSDGSVPSPLGRSFVFKGRNSGKQLVGHRYGPGKWGTLQGAKTIFAPHPGSELGIERLAPRIKWQQTGERELNANLAAKIQAALDGGAVSPVSGSD